MSEELKQDVKNAELKAMEDVRDLFALAHDLIQQASHPGHLAPKIQQVTQFLAFQYSSLKAKAEAMAKSLESKIDVPAAEAAVQEALAPTSEAPKA